MALWDASPDRDRGHRADRVGRASLLARVALSVALVALAVVFGACSPAAPSATPTSVPTPVVTPDPHLPDPTTADDVFLALGQQGLRLTASNATTGSGGLVKRINASFGGWPLIISEYVSAAALADATDWPAGEPPGGNEPPVAVAAANILVTWGPTSNAAPEPPDAARAARLVPLAAALDALLGPVRVRTVVPLALETVPAAASGPTSSVGPEVTAAP